MTTKAKLGRVVDPDDGAPGSYDEHDSRYNPADFVLSGQDHQGHNERIFCRVQPQVARQMNMVFRGKKFPFRTEGDIFRWCVVRGLKVLDRLEPQPGFLGMADAINEILRQETYMQEFLDMFGAMEKVINVHMASGATKEARKLLSTVLRMVRTSGEDDDTTYWKKKCEDDVMRRFGHLMEGSRRTQLTGGRDE